MWSSTGLHPLPATFVSSRKFRWLLCIKSIFTWWFLQKLKAPRSWYHVWDNQHVGNFIYSYNAWGPSIRSIDQSHFWVICSFPMHSSVFKSWSQWNDKGWVRVSAPIAISAVCYLPWLSLRHNPRPISRLFSLLYFLGSLCVRKWWIFLAFKILYGSSHIPSNYSDLWKAFL